MLKNNKTTGVIDIPNCDLKGAEIYDEHVKIIEDYLFIHMKAGDTHILKATNLSSTDQESCIPIVGAYFGKHKIFTYHAEKNRDLVRWTILPGGRKYAVEFIGRTNFVCF